MMVALDDLEEVPERQEQVVNVCLMTNSESKEVISKPYTSCKKIEYLFDNLLYNSQIITKKNDKLRDKVTKIICHKRITYIKLRCQNF
jgi:hypothetical protein